MVRVFILFLISFGFSQVDYNHPELDWQTIETDHFMIHFYGQTELYAREGATVAEKIYPHVTQLYQYEPPSKTHIIFLDTDDISNGAAYYYDNKIYIWTSPLDFELRGSHRWLQNVITHEFTHIVSIQTAMKAGMKIPGAYLQWMGYEKEKRKDVLYGYPNTLVSYPIPGTVVPPWLAEGTAQYMYEGADLDNWDTHRDMILRDRVLHNNLLTFTEMNTFGKTGIGNESTYNAGYAMCRFIAEKYGTDKLKMIMVELSSPFQFSIGNAIKRSIGITGDELYNDFQRTLEQYYEKLTESIKTNRREGKVLLKKGTTNLHPIWSPDGNRFAFISNQENDYFSQTDLFVYDMKSGMEEKFVSGVKSAVTWNPSGDVIYFSKKPTFPNKHGSKYFDLFEYNFKNDEEDRLTEEARAFSPVFITRDSSLAYISTRGGIQNVFLLNLDSKSITQVTDYKDHRILHTLAINKNTNKIIVDYTLNHFRNISQISLNNLHEEDILANSEWDERDPSFSSAETIIYSDDRSGVFNLYSINRETKEQGYLTNATGGAFMSDVNKSGQVIYSLYDNGRYSIALLDSQQFVNSAVVGYSPDYYLRNQYLSQHIGTKDSTVPSTYQDAFPPMFLMPKLMIDYGTLKPGFFFYSSEVLQRLSVFGGASMNTMKDLDLFFLFEFKRFYPTLFAQVFYLTRNKTDSFNWRDVYPIDDNLKFRMLAFKSGFRVPILGMHSLEIYTLWQRYRAHVKQNIPTENIQGGASYDYYRGVVTGVNLHTSASKSRADGNINPSNGFDIDVHVAYENNDFIDGLDFSDAGTLIEQFKQNDLGRIELKGSYHWEIPYTNRLCLSAHTDLGWITTTKVDSFFNYFAGGMDGIKGYSFYSIEGTNKAIAELDFRIPLFREKHYALGWFILQNSVLGFIVQAGDAWTTTIPDWKKSVGIQWRVNGFSFYNYPTAIGVEAHYGLDNFEKKNINYGEEIRWYFTALFGF